MGQASYTSNTMFFSDFLDKIVLESEPEPKASGCWNRSLKFEYRLHSLGTQRT